jgi:hypothetical protein
MRDHYIGRKLAELELVNGSPVVRPPSNPKALLRHKMSLAVRQKLRFIAANSDATETAVARTSVSNPSFHFRYNYQRADFRVDGPAIYDAVLAPGQFAETRYASCGMAAMICVFTALRRLNLLNSIELPEGCYAETVELAHHLGETCSPGGLKVLDSAAPGFCAQYVDRHPVVIIDTSCLATSSGNLRRWLKQAHARGAIAILVRSHTKLDFLGTEYGRLGSIVVVDNCDERRAGLVRQILDQLGDAIRLSGAAPAPWSFPPFVADPRWSPLTRKRVANMIRNTRRLSVELSRCSVPHTRYRHGLYLTAPIALHGCPEVIAKQADVLVNDLRRSGIAAHHAGSFGFDFITIDWFTDTVRNAFVLRVAAGDLPTGEMDQAAAVLATGIAAAQARNIRNGL